MLQNKVQLYFTREKNVLFKHVNLMKKLPSFNAGDKKVYFQKAMYVLKGTEKFNSGLSGATNLKSRKKGSIFLYLTKTFNVINRSETVLSTN
jgi:hypothetical protein